MANRNLKLVAFTDDLTYNFNVIPPRPVVVTGACPEGFRPPGYYMPGELKIFLDLGHLDFLRSLQQPVSG